MGVIYKITHRPTGKCYIGQTERDPWDRWIEHKNSNSFHEELSTKSEDFRFEVIECCPNNMLNDRERFWIESLQTIVPNGFNKNSGGFVIRDGRRSWLGRIVNEIQKEENETYHQNLH